MTRSAVSLSSAGSVCTGPGTMIGSRPSGRTSNRSRRVRPHSTRGYPASCRPAATVAPTAPGPTNAMRVATCATVPAVTAHLDWAVAPEFRQESFVLRTHAAGSLRATDGGQKVTLAGWVARRRDHGGVIFIDLRDASGVSQVVFREGDMAQRAHRLRAEFCLQVTGIVAVRPEGNENPDIPTGAIEVTAEELTVLSESAPLPFPLDEHLEVGEEI